MVYRLLIWRYKMKTLPVSEIFEDERKTDRDYAKWVEEMEALASFITDYEHLKSLNGYSQKEIADKAGTTQSAISRFLRMKGKPTYDLLRRVSSAAGGELLVTPFGLYSVTLQYEFHDIADKIASEAGMGVPELLKKILNDYFEAFLLRQHRQEHEQEKSDCSLSPRENLPNREQETIAFALPSHTSKEINQTDSSKVCLKKTAVN